MLEPITANIVLCSAAAVVDIITLALLLIQSSDLPRSRYLIASDVLHLTVTQEIIYANVLAHNGIVSVWTEAGRLYVTSVRWVILLLMICCVISDRNGRKTVINRQEPLDVPFIICAFGPMILGIMINTLFDDLTVDDFCYAVSFLLCAVALLRERWLDLKLREETLNIRQAKLLTEQMSPHFVFNSLSSIQYLIYSDPEKAGQRLEDFTGYLRGNLDALTNENPIPFSVELEHIRQYVALTRAGSAFPFKVEYQLNAGEFMIPALTVQPIVENAVKHGALSRKDGTGLVTLTTERLGGLIRISVEDNGIGVSMTDNQLQRQKVGVANARSRLETQCGGTLSISSSDSGSRAVINVPYKEVG